MYLAWGCSTPKGGRCAAAKFCKLRRVNSKISCEIYIFFSTRHIASSKITCCPVWFKAKIWPNWRCSIKLNLAPSVDKYHKHSSLETHTKKVSLQFNALFLSLVQSWSEELFFPPEALKHRMDNDYYVYFITHMQSCNLNQHFKKSSDDCNELNLAVASRDCYCHSPVC